MVHSETIEHSDNHTIAYQTGFGNTFESECIPGALPIGRSTPRLVPYNLYTEQLSGTAFTAPRSENRRTWLYRIQPSVVVEDVIHDETCCCRSNVRAVDDAAVGATSGDVNNNNNSNGPPHESCFFGGVDPATCETNINPLRWKPLKLAATVTAVPEEQQQGGESTTAAATTAPTVRQPKIDFIRGMKLITAAGDPSMKSGLAMYMYSGNCSMTSTNRHLYTADGEFLIVPQQGTLVFITEVGKLQVQPGEIIVIPRGLVFQVNSTDETIPFRGYVLEVYSSSFQLPELGPIGSNGLANARDFYYPTAACAATSPEDYEQPTTIVGKMHSRLHFKPSSHSPYNVVAWHGNYLPYKYDLSKFCAVNSVTYDHLDPSIYTVLTCPSEHQGTAVADFVIFPPRIMATDSNTLRPPWFHRNCMSEFMGLIHGSYDAKQDWLPGAASLHNCMTPHGPDTASYEKAVADECLQPTKFEGGLAFMFETCLSLKVSPTALYDDTWRDVQYTAVWQGLTAAKFTGWDLLAAAAANANQQRQQQQQQKLQHEKKE